MCVRACTCVRVYLNIRGQRGRVDVTRLLRNDSDYSIKSDHPVAHMIATNVLNNVEYALHHVKNTHAHECSHTPIHSYAPLLSGVVVVGEGVQLTNFPVNPPDAHAIVDDEIEIIDQRNLGAGQGWRV